MFDSKRAGQSYISSGLMTTVGVMRGLQQQQWFKHQVVSVVLDGQSDQYVLSRCVLSGSWGAGVSSGIACKGILEGALIALGSSF